MKFESILKILVVVLIISYCLIKILHFYGIGINVYGSYLAFYGFLLLTIFILPTSYPQIIT
jgi:hypothetical protein